MHCFNCSCNVFHINLQSHFSPLCYPYISLESNHFSQQLCIFKHPCPYMYYVLCLEPLPPLPFLSGTSFHVPFKMPAIFWLCQCLFCEAFLDVPPIFWMQLYYYVILIIYVHVYIHIHIYLLTMSSLREQIYSSLPLFSVFYTKFDMEWVFIDLFSKYWAYAKC